MEKVSMSHVDLKDLEPGLQTAAGGRLVLGDQVLQIAGCEFAGHRRRFVEGNRAWPQRLPTAPIRSQGGAAHPGNVRRGLAAGMGDLYGRNGAVGLDKKPLSA